MPVDGTRSERPNGNIEIKLGQRGGSKPGESHGNPSPRRSFGRRRSFHPAANARETWSNRSIASCGTSSAYTAPTPGLRSSTRMPSSSVATMASRGGSLWRICVSRGIASSAVAPGVSSTRTSNAEELMTLAYRRTVSTSSTAPQKRPNSPEASLPQGGSIQTPRGLEV